MIPKLIHFVFGLAPDFAGMPFSFYHYLAVRSAKAFNPDCEIVVHFYHTPDNALWEDLRRFAKFNRLATVPAHFGTAEIVHTAHKADAVRMAVLRAHGGIYLDMDTICIAPFTPLLAHDCVMGIEMWNGRINGLCNAVILAHPQSEFLRRWSDSYSEFNPQDWNHMSVRKPMALAQQHPELIHIEPPESFFRLTWEPDDLNVVHNQCITFPRSHCLHLWESAAYKHLLHISEADILERDCSYNLLARQVLRMPVYAPLQTEHRATRPLPIEMADLAG